MKFFNTRIVTKTVQLGDALKAEPKATRSLDEILADIQHKGQVKTASSAGQVKTAAKKETVIETLTKQAMALNSNYSDKKASEFIQQVKLAFQGELAPAGINPTQKGAVPGDVSMAVTPNEGAAALFVEQLKRLGDKAPEPLKSDLEALLAKYEEHPLGAQEAAKGLGEHMQEGSPGRGPGIGQAPPIKASSEKETKEAKKKLPPEFLEHIKGKKGKEKKEDGDEKEEKEAKKAPRTLKMASSLDFRQWEAEDVVRAWGQHGAHDKCVANVKDLVNEPATYCKLLQVASTKAASIVKTASKEASKKQASPKGVFKKLAKLSDEEASFLKEYWRNLYGDAYVESMMKDY